ncbi:MAG: hypothetical protein FJ033_14340 [Chloroflexi bacterium]|nr:hypothetical protein [Chloroflexota bacterium]
MARCSLAGLLESPSPGPHVSDLAPFWRDVLSDLNRQPMAATIDPLDLRSTDFARCHAVRLSSVDDYRLFAYFSAPDGSGPHPAILHASGYASVVQVPSYEERRTYASLAMCARGQRLSDRPYAAAFPGLLTDRIEDPGRSPLRGIVADNIRAVEFLSGQSEVDPDRIVVVGSDMALFATALAPGIRAAVVADPLLVNLGTLAHTVHDYPHEEINDYLRAFPDREETVRASLEIFDPSRLSDRIAARVLLSCGPPGSYFDRGRAETLARRIPRAEIYERTGRGYLDRIAIERWIAEAIAA